MYYQEFLARIHEALLPEAYLEIGIDEGDTLALSRTRTIAIDPAPKPRASTLAGKPWLKLYAMTSDHFFSERSAEATLEGARLDLAFIDGLHEFAQVVRDLEHVEAWGHPGTLVVIHDVIPETVHQASHTFREGGWTGDVWRVVPFLQAYRPDLDCELVNARNSGILLVTHLDPSRCGMSEMAAALDLDFPGDGPDYDRLVENWLAEAKPLSPDAALRAIRKANRPIHYRLEGEGWQVEKGVWVPTGELPRCTVWIRLVPPIRGAHRARLEFGAKEIEVVQVRFSSVGIDIAHERTIYLDVKHPGALHHDLDSVWLTFDEETGLFELDWEGVLAQDEQLTGIGISAVDFEFRQSQLTPGMTLDLRCADFEQILWPRSGTPFAPQRFPDRAPRVRSSGGKRDAVIFSWCVPNDVETRKVGEYYLGLLQYHHSDSKVFVGFNHGSNPEWVDRFAEAGLDVDIASARPEIGDYWDATGFLTALERFDQYDEEFDLVWFGHTKGASRPSYKDYIQVRFQHDRRFWSRRTAIHQYFANPQIGLFAHRYGLHDSTDVGSPGRGTVELDALERIYRDRYPPLGLWAWETTFVMRESIVRHFCREVGQGFFLTDPSDYGADRWWFEGAFPSISSMQGYEPYIEIDTDGSGSPRNDLMRFEDPRQSNRLALEELQRWREDPYAFRPRGLPKAYA